MLLGLPDRLGRRDPRDRKATPVRLAFRELPDSPGLRVFRVPVGLLAFAALQASAAKTVCQVLTALRAWQDLRANPVPLEQRAVRVSPALQAATDVLVHRDFKARKANRALRVRLSHPSADRLDRRVLQAATELPATVDCPALLDRSVLPGLKGLLV